MLEAIKDILLKQLRVDINSITEDTRIVTEVTYKTSDGSATGEYWPSGSGKNDDSKLVKYKTFYVGADSLDVVEMLMTIEQDYGVIVPDDVIATFKTVGDVARYIENNQQ